MRQIGDGAAADLQRPGRVMALDVGTRRIGVAMSDPTQNIAQPYTTVERSSWRADVAALAAIIQQEEVVAVVLGLPRHMKGSVGASSHPSLELAARLRKACPQVPLFFCDERLTTVMAQKSLLEADLSRARRRQLADHVAAALILQTFLARRDSAGRYKEGPCGPECGNAEARNGDERDAGGRGNPDPR
ncbi:MAG: Holliday junction resolvase RuvX [Firmicutes bacterium]|nr:Holliday junction resolvase RuvX [Bacillota bacterium]